MFGHASPSGNPTQNDSFTLSTSTENDDSQFLFQTPNPLKSFIRRRQNSQERGQKRSHSSGGGESKVAQAFSSRGTGGVLQSGDYEEEIQASRSKRTCSPNTMSFSPPPSRTHRTEIPFRPSSEPSYPGKFERERSPVYKETDSPRPALFRGIEGTELTFTGSITEEQLRQMNQGVTLDDNDNDAEESDDGYRGGEDERSLNITNPSELSEMTEQDVSTFAIPTKPQPGSSFRLSRINQPVLESPPNSARSTQGFPQSGRNLLSHPISSNLLSRRDPGYDDSYPSDTASTPSNPQTLSEVLFLDPSSSSMKKRVQFFRDCTREQWAAYGEQLCNRHLEVTRQLIEARENRARIIATFEKELEEKGRIVDQRFENSRAYMAKLRNNFGLLL